MKFSRTDVVDRPWADCQLGDEFPMNRQNNLAATGLPTELITLTSKYCIDKLDLFSVPGGLLGVF